jgi:hypothetical protein
MPPGYNSVSEKESVVWFGGFGVHRAEIRECKIQKSNAVPWLRKKKVKKKTLILGIPRIRRLRLTNKKRRKNGPSSARYGPKQKCLKSLYFVLDSSEW